MDPIAIAPVPTPAAPAPVKEPQAAPENKDENCAKTEGFDKKLKKELSLLKPEHGKLDGELPIDKDALAKLADDAKDQAGITDPAAAALLAQNAMQPQAALNPHAGK